MFNSTTRFGLAPRVSVTFLPGTGPFLPSAAQVSSGFTRWLARYRSFGAGCVHAVWPVRRLTRSVWYGWSVVTMASPPKYAASLRPDQSSLLSWLPSVVRYTTRMSLPPSVADLCASSTSRSPMTVRLSSAGSTVDVIIHLSLPVAGSTPCTVVVPAPVSE